MHWSLRRQIVRSYDRITGRRIHHLLKRLDRNQWLSRDELEKLQFQKLHSMLQYAQRHVPYYKKLFSQAGFRPDDLLRDRQSFQAVPLLTRQIIRSQLDSLVTTESARLTRLRSLSTSGSTGSPLVFKQDPCCRDHFTAYVHHHLCWGGWQLGTPHASIGGSSLEAKTGISLRNKLMNWTWNRCAVNGYVLSEEVMRDFVDRMRRSRTQLLYGYASSIYTLARFVRATGQDRLPLRSVFSSSEVLHPHQRELIADTFGAAVFDRYATRELGEIGCQCERQGGLHTSVENVFVEILNEEERPVGPGEPGRVVVTSLTNFGMPFIRYDLADVSAWSREQTCGCGRKQPMLSGVEGRDNDMLRARDGRIVWGGITNPLWEVPGVRQFQFVQKNYDLVVVRIVKDGHLEDEPRRRVRGVIRAALGDHVEVRFEYPSDIPVHESGKRRYQICELSPRLRTAIRKETPGA